jgi:filamentous hemagglutinin family protein
MEKDMTHPVVPPQLLISATVDTQDISLPANSGGKAISSAKAQGMIPMPIVPEAFPAEMSIEKPLLLAQAIVPNVNDTGTVVSSPVGNPNQFDITGGKEAGSNLFHGLQRFGLEQGQVANFQANPAIQNILVRVSGGNASYVNGLIQVPDSNANLFLMNPAGMMFGPNASLNVPAAFTATTANGIGFGQGWFNAVGNNNYEDLVGVPSSLAFSLSQPGSIVNLGNLAVKDGQSLALVGGTIVNTGQLSAPGGQITVTAVPGTSLLKIESEGSLLSFEIDSAAIAGNLPGAEGVQSLLSLPELLTGGQYQEATELKVYEDGRVELTGSGTKIGTKTGDVTTSGRIDTSANLADGSGDIINIFGKNVNLVDSDNINTFGEVSDASVRTGLLSIYGGDIKIGNLNSVKSLEIIDVNSIQTGNIKTSRLVNLSSIGKIFTGNIETPNLQILGKSDVVVGDIKYDYNYYQEGKISVNSGQQIKAGNISTNTRYAEFIAVNDIEVGDIKIFGVNLTVKSLQGDIVVNTINASPHISLATSASPSSIKIDAFGKFRARGYFTEDTSFAKTFLQLPTYIQDKIARLAESQNISRQELEQSKAIFEIKLSDLPISVINKTFNGIATIDIRHGGLAIENSSNGGVSITGRGEPFSFVSGIRINEIQLPENFNISELTKSWIEPIYVLSESGGLTFPPTITGYQSVYSKFSIKASNIDITSSNDVFTNTSGTRGAIIATERITGNSLSPILSVDTSFIAPIANITTTPANPLVPPAPTISDNPPTSSSLIKNENSTLPVIKTEGITPSTSSQPKERQSSPTSEYPQLSNIERQIIQSSHTINYPQVCELERIFTTPENSSQPIMSQANQSTSTPSAKPCPTSSNSSILKIIQPKSTQAISAPL